MKRIKTKVCILVAIFGAVANCMLPTVAFSQCLPMVKIDGNNIIADDNHAAGIKLPSWLKTAQTLEKGQYVFSMSVIEFTVNGTALDYSQNLSVTTIQTVPAGKVWKIESIHKDATMSAGVSTIYSTAGSYTFTPSCSGSYSIKVWGAGGGGGYGDNGSCWGSAVGGGGGAGGYTEGTYFLTAGTNYAVTVGTSGAAGWPGTVGGNSTVGTIGLTATGGAGGTCSSPGIGGAGGTGSGGQVNYIGQTGTNGTWASNGGKGGDGPNSGGAGGAGGASAAGSAGTSPGGGGGGGGYGVCLVAGSGGSGKVMFASASSSSVTLTPKIPCVTLYQYSSGACTSTAPSPCPSGWSDAGCGNAFYGGAWTYIRTCYRCD